MLFSRTFAGYALAFLATVVWSGNFIVARGLAETLSPIELSFWRWFIALLTLAPFTLRTVWRHLPLLRGCRLRVALMAVLGISLFNTFIYQAGHSTAATNMSLLAATSPVIIAGMARVFLGEALSLAQVTGLLCATAGVLVLVSRGSLEVFTTLSFSSGDLWMLIAVILFAVYSLMLRHRPAGFPQAAFLTLLVAIGLLGLLPFMLWQTVASPSPSLSMETWGALIYVGMGASVFSFLCWSLAVERIGMVRAGIIYCSISLFASLEAALLLGEAMTLPQIIGGGLILGGILYASLGDLRRKKA